jgi:hypothetical protein
VGLREFDQLGLQLLGKRVTPPVGDPSWQIDDRVVPVAGEVLLNKTSSSALSSTKLDKPSTIGDQLARRVWVNYGRLHDPNGARGR